MGIVASIRPYSEIFNERKLKSEQLKFDTFSPKMLEVQNYEISFAFLKIFNKNILLCFIIKYICKMKFLIQCVLYYIVLINKTISLFFTYAEPNLQRLL